MWWNTTGVIPQNRGVNRNTTLLKAFVAMLCVLQSPTNLVVSWHVALRGHVQWGGSGFGLSFTLIQFGKCSQSTEGIPWALWHLQPRSNLLSQFTHPVTHDDSWIQRYVCRINWWSNVSIVVDISYIHSAGLVNHLSIHLDVIMVMHLHESRYHGMMWWRYWRLKWVA